MSAHVIPGLCKDGEEHEPEFHEDTEGSYDVVCGINVIRWYECARCGVRERTSDAPPSLDDDLDGLA